MAVSVAFCSIGGNWLDGYFDASPWFTTIGILLGLALAVKTVLRVVREYQRSISSS